MRVRHLVLALSLVVSIAPLPAQSAVPVERLSSGVVFIRKEEAPESPSGTAFFIYSGAAFYLVTAEHVSRLLSLASPITVATADGRPFTFPISRLVPKSTDLKWFTHAHADVAVLPIDPAPDFAKEHLVGHFMPSSWLEAVKGAPLRGLTITVLGFPLRLGVSQYFSPISRETRAASGLLEFRRFDNGVMSTFFVTQDPSVGGFSGAPVFDTRLPYSSERAALDLRQVGSEPRIVGLVHGTLSDQTGGKFGAIVPGFIILEVLEQARSRPSK